jgi:hypothetical protein
MRAIEVKTRYSFLFGDISILSVFPSLREGIKGRV